MEIIYHRSVKKVLVGIFFLYIGILLGAILYSAGHPATPTVTQTVLGQTTKTTDCTITNGLPDHNCTPGGINPAVTQDTIYSTICVSGYTTRIRPPVTVTNTIKKERLAAYGFDGSMKDYELDHLISLELGGCTDCVSNLWPEPYNSPMGARQKDTVENYLNKEVCSGAMSLKEAQEKIANDWISAYNTLPVN
jgi:hypothetical protein